MAVNMMDVVEKSGEKIHTDKLSKKLGCEVVEISALKGTGISKAAEKAVEAQQKQKMQGQRYTSSHTKAENMYGRG